MYTNTSRALNSQNPEWTDIQLGGQTTKREQTVCSQTPPTTHSVTETQKSTTSCKIAYRHLWQQLAPTSDLGVLEFLCSSLKPCFFPRKTIFKRCGHPKSSTCSFLLLLTVGHHLNQGFFKLWISSPGSFQSCLSDPVMVLYKQELLSQFSIL